MYSELCYIEVVQAQLRYGTSLCKTTFSAYPLLCWRARFERVPARLPRINQPFWQHCARWIRRAMINWVDQGDTLYPRKAYGGRSITSVVVS